MNQNQPRPFSAVRPPSRGHGVEVYEKQQTHPPYEATPSDPITLAIQAYEQCARRFYSPTAKPQEAGLFFVMALCAANWANNGVVLEKLRKMREFNPPQKGIALDGRVEEAAEIVKIQ